MVYSFTVLNISVVKTSQGLGLFMKLTSDPERCGCQPPPNTNSWLCLRQKKLSRALKERYFWL